MQSHSKKPIVLYILTKLELGGAQKVCLTLFKGISERGLSSGLISGTEGVLVSQVQGYDNVHLLKEFKREIGLKNLISEIKSFFSLFRLMKKIKREHPMVVVHTHSTKAGVLGRLAAFFAGISERVHTVHGFGFNDFQSRPVRLIMISIEYVMSLLTTHYVCVSENDRAIGAKLFPYFAQKSSLIRAAVDWDCFCINTRVKAIDSNLIIGTVSCFKPQKNLIDLLRAFKYVYNKLSVRNRNRIFLHIIGDGALRSDLEAFVRENGLEDKVVFLGWQANVNLFMQGWNIFAMSSLWEGLPCAIIEARLSKLPVVCYDVGGIAEVVVNDKNGFVVKIGQWHMLADKLLCLVQNDQLRTTIANYNDNLDAFKNSTMIYEHETLYRKLTEGNGLL